MKYKVTRKVRMGWYVEQICRVLQRLPVTQANEIELEALWLNIKDSHSDIVDKLNTTTAPKGKGKQNG